MSDAEDNVDDKEDDTTDDKTVDDAKDDGVDDGDKNSVDDTEDGDKSSDDTSSDDQDDDPSKKSSDEDEKSEDEDDGEEKSEGAPAEYEAFTVPDDIEVDEAFQSQFTEAARAADLSQAEAQGFVDLYIDGLEKMEQSQQGRWEEVKSHWAKQAAELDELRGDDGTADEAFGVSRRVAEKLGGDELMEALTLTGAGSHPQVVLAFNRLSKLVLADGFVVGDPGEQKASGARRMFPSMPND